MQGFEQGMTEQIKEVKHLKVQPLDKLSIVIGAENPELAQIFNLTYLAQSSSTTTTSTGGNYFERYSYTVSPNGDITIPILGDVHVAGLDRSEIAKLIEKGLRANDLIKNPTVIVNFENATISVLGEVGSPGNIEIMRDDMTIFQAIAAAGDLKMSGLRENVLLVREEGGKDVAYRIDLTNAASIIESPAYYVQQNDVIYVEPNNTAKRQTTANGNSVLTPGFWVSIVSFLTSMSLLIFR